jgi:hypothetical protein
MLEEHTTKEKGSVMCFILAEGLTAKDIHKEMFSIYGENCLLGKTIHNWVEKFSHGCSKVTDDENEVWKWLRQQSKTFMLWVSIHW